MAGGGVRGYLYQGSVWPCGGRAERRGSGRLGDQQRGRTAAVAGWWRQRWSTGGGSGGRQVGLTDFFSFFIFCKNVCRVSVSSMANFLPSAYETTHGKEVLCRSFYAVRSLSCV